MLVVTGCTYDRDTGRFESVPPYGSNTVEGVRMAMEGYRTREVVVLTEPPVAPPVEVVAAERAEAPEGFANPYFVEGFYAWGGRDWYWVPGEWVDRPSDAAVFVASTITVRDGQRYWQPWRWE